MRNPNFAVLVLLAGLVGWTAAACAEVLVRDWPRATLDELGGPDFTPLGAERAGNADGSIPAWEGGLTRPPANYQSGRQERDPWPQDPILHTVTADNVGQYVDLLSPGQRALLKAYPATWRVPVYRSRRSAAFPEWVYQGVLANARRFAEAGAEATYEQARISSPFPIPRRGEEVMWNHNLRWRGLRIQRPLARAAVTPLGRFTLIVGDEDIGIPYAAPQQSRFSKEYPNVLLAIKSKFTGPSLLANDASLVLEPIDHRVSKRKAWSYLESLRRVVRQPFLAYHQPALNSDALRTVDDYELFNGGTDRFEWQLLGKREMLIPYNAYRLHSDQLAPEDIIRRGHINPAHTRYERHRVWVVEGRLKADKQHVYSRRVFYLDEDSWQVVVSESYDLEGQLWRVAEAHIVNFYTVPVPLATLYVYHDLKQRRYLVDGLDNQMTPYRFLESADPREFSPNALLYYVR
ncbi:DUF1329 domain-containing protein [Aestuariicella hydrocarbonica]|uniref:DUF1329 domain-containing protein n=1 Tax=Pseudomaricurvus hydrocarbonicus TaxID=1470433 RepID=A0A9E5MJ69_9GAMM|nr:DUF1329 domain-containing protein [Aestuariicella hydrocarbonica]NHO64599.1 DUF1329 domain-containing protein [Aestuariicella hydrocarbonica]